MTEIDGGRLFPSLDLCLAIAASETEPFLRYLWVRPEVLLGLQRAARLALPELMRAASSSMSAPPGVPVETGSDEERAAALATVRSVARAVVPRLPVYRAAGAWIETLLELEAAGRLQMLEAKQDVRDQVRGTVWAIIRLRRDLEDHEAVYRDRWADAGGWAQLTMILDWEFFRRIWERLARQHSEAEVTAVVAWVQRALPDRELRDPRELIATHTQG